MLYYFNLIYPRCVKSVGINKTVSHKYFIQQSITGFDLHNDHHQSPPIYQKKKSS